LLAWRAACRWLRERAREREPIDKSWSDGLKGNLGCIGFRVLPDGSQGIGAAPDLRVRRGPQAGPSHRHAIGTHHFATWLTLTRPIRCITSVSSISQVYTFKTSARSGPAGLNSRQESTYNRCRMPRLDIGPLTLIKSARLTGRFLRILQALTICLQ
jgi:hypothetical protein